MRVAGCKSNTAISIRVGGGGGTRSNGHSAAINELTDSSLK